MTQDKKDGLTQSERFMQAARELECDNDPERFKDTVRKISKPKPTGRPDATSSGTGKIEEER